MDAYAAGDYQTAERELRVAVHHDPRSAEAHRHLGRALLQLEQWTEAIQRLIRSYELLPEHRKRELWLSLWEDLVEALAGLLRSGAWDEAVVALAEVHELEALTPATTEQLAAVFSTHALELLREGRIEQALAAFAHSEGIRSGEPNAL